MSLGANKQALMGSAGAAGGGGGVYSHQIANSCRFNASANSHMHRTQGTPTNVDKCTISLWVKRGKLGAAMYAFTGSGKGGGGGQYSHLSFGGDGNDPDLFYYLQNPGSVSVRLESTALFRDPNAWMHLVIAQDSTQGTAANRNKLYINGTLYADYGSYTDYSTLNSDFLMNSSGHKVFVGSGGDSAGGVYLPYDGYIAEYVFIDGTQYDISDFGETFNGVWQPKDPSGLTFGSNGFYLKFESSGDLGNDSSGNNNDFTLSNVSAHDQMLDTPTFNADSNGGNFATYSPLTKGSYTDIAEGNLKADSNTGADASYPSGNIAFPSSGKWYYEQLIETKNSTYPTPFLVAFGDYGYDLTRGLFWSMRFTLAGTAQKNTGANIQQFGTITLNSTGSSSFAAGDIMSWYIDMDNKKAWIAKNGTIPNSGAPASGTNPQFAWTTNPQHGFTFGSQEYQSSSTIVNTGSDGTFAGNKTAQGNSDDTGYGNFYYDPPTGFLALCTGNMPIADAINPAETDDNYPQKQFNALLYTGDGGSSRAITGLGFQPDWIWIKRRNTTENHNMYDAVRGANKRIVPNSVAVQTTEGLPAIGSDGFTVDASGSINNVSSQTYVSWNAKANGAGSSNGDGGTTSTVSANTAIGFSIVQYAGSGGTQTMGHGLDKAPEFMSCKPTAGYAYQWVTYHRNGNAGATSQNGYLSWQTDSGFNSLSGIWSNTAPTDTVFTTGGSQNTGASGGTYINYCWHSVEGVTDVGMYTGNGSTDNAFIYTGFKPAFIIIKGLASGAGWNLHDNKTSPFNVASTVLQSNTNSAELSNYNIDMLSNGFKIRDADGDLGTNGNKYIYVAMAENPFKYATAR